MAFRLLTPRADNPRLTLRNQSLEGVPADSGANEEEMVGVAGFEPAAPLLPNGLWAIQPASRNRCNQRIYEDLVCCQICARLEQTTRNFTRFRVDYPARSSSPASQCESDLPRFVSRSRGKASHTIDKLDWTRTQATQRREPGLTGNLARRLQRIPILSEVVLAKLPRLNLAPPVLVFLIPVHGFENAFVPGFARAPAEVA